MAIITISRQAGSMGDALAEKLAQESGYECIDKEIIGRAAQLAQASPEQIERFDERRPSRVQRLMDVLLGPQSRGEVLSFPSSWLAAADPFGVYVPYLYYDREEEEDEGDEEEAARFVSQQECFEVFRKVIEAVAETGNAVIVGRGGQIILRDHPAALHLRTVASPAFRIQHLIEDHGVSKDDARTVMRRTDRRRRNYMRFYYDAEWRDSKLYHLVINMEKWPLDALVQTLVAATKAIAEP